MDDSGAIYIPIYINRYEGYTMKLYASDINPSEDSQMKADWGSLPLLALKQILRYLNRADALSCMSTCRHWRTAMLMYEGRKTTLKLRMNDLERSLFVSRIFRKHTKRLFVLVNTNDMDLIKTFVKTVMPLFYNTKLQELTFVGNSYIFQSKFAPVPELPRTAIESVLMNLHSLNRLALMGCKLSSSRNGKLELKDKENIQGSENVRLRVSNYDPSPCDSVLSKCNTDLMMYSNLEGLILDYELITTESLETLSQLKMFRYLTMLIRDKPNFRLKPINWLRLQTCYTQPLIATVCLIQLQDDKIGEVMDNVFIQGLQLVALKAFYCKTMHMEAIVQVVNMYSKSLEEFVWVDCPYDSTDQSLRSLSTVRLPELNMCNVNPLILMSWQCERLRRVVIHGYWIWQYDVLGMLRLRDTLRHLELSSLVSPRSRAARLGDGISRVMKGDMPQRFTAEFLEQLSSFRNETGWTPVPYKRLHAGLRAGATQRDRADYVLLETRVPVGVTYPYTMWRPSYFNQLCDE